MQRENIVIQSNNSTLTLQVNNDLKVEIQTNPEFDFLMDSNMVALGYGVSINTVRSHKMIHKDELIENIHFISRVEKTNSRSNLTNKKHFWTKAGVIRLGFFIVGILADVCRIEDTQLRLSLISKLGV